VNKKSIADHGVDGMVTIVSKNQGWITVSPTNIDRKHPVEKGGIGGDVTKTSILTPSWMNLQYPKNKSDSMMATVEKFGLRNETNRTFLFDKSQPQKSVFAYGQIRHNVHSKEAAEEFMKGASRDPPQLIGWKEEPAKQRFDKKIAGKIGSYHE